MSQLETLMLVGLGFAVALLLALVVGRFAWNTAIRLGSRKRIQSAPAEAVELQTDRDRLRAEYAVMSRKLELRLDDLKARLVEQMAEVSRNRNRIQTMAEELERRDQAASAKDTEIQTLAVQKAKLEKDLLAQTNTVEALTSRLAARDGTEDGKAAAEGAAVLAAEIDSSVDERLKHRIAALTAMSAEIADQRRTLQTERSNLADAPEEAAAAIEAKIEAAEKDADTLTDELKKLDDVWGRQLKAKPARYSAIPALEPPVYDEEAMKASGTTGRPLASGIANVISLAQRIRALKQEM
jgi:chromosome segregation ATPase